MANIKFSQFTQKTTLGTVDFLVGYTGAQNIQIDPVDLLSAYPTGSGGTGRIAFWEPSNNLSSDYLFKWDNSSNRLGIGVETPTATLHVVTADDTIAKFVSSDNKAAISISDDDTTGYFSAENGRIGFGPGLGASSSNISIQTSNSNVGIGTVSPMAKLHVYGTLIATGISQLGSGGSNVLLTSSSGGNVGIGTSSPAEKLHVEGGNSYTPIRFDGNGNYSGYLYNDGGGIGIKDSSGTNIGNLIYLHTAGNNMRLYTSGSERIRIDSSGNVGIGTSSPTAKLHIQSSDNAATANLVYLENIGSGGSEGVSIKFNPMFNAESMIASNREGALANACNLTFHTYSNTTNEAMRITSAGNVGIGTTSPGAKLDIVTDSAGSQIELTSPTPGLKLIDSNLTTRYAEIKAENGNVNIDIDPGQAEGTSYFSVDIDNSEKFRITKDGNVGIGTTSPSAPLDFGKSTYGDVDTDAFYRVKFQDQGGVANDVGIGQTETGSLGFNVTAGKKYTFSTGTSGTLLELSSVSASFINIPKIILKLSTNNTRASFDGSGNYLNIRAADNDTSKPQMWLGNGTDEGIYANAAIHYWRNTSSNNYATLSSAGLDVEQGDVEVENSSNGLILKSPDGTRYRVRVANGGTLSVSAV